MFVQPVSSTVLISEYCIKQSQCISIAELLQVKQLVYIVRRDVRSDDKIRIRLY